ncbi:pilus assembly protein TadG-related protein [Porphyrobacter sp. LM 6]|uniref:pilus assembly protein TadG-related protein n=1 Tax=Porphyrobacter sp. LM 6 TaxID=1896196 RepID=UPI0008473A3E|nr:pilus assembly protein TadG-related protein [Porphyrobacter sp. LM 6]AOL93190.1 Flp pilus assembly protein TadG [Porphyrobacter sp. LM 6]
MSEPRFLVDFARDRNAAIAPLYAIALFALIMIAGVGWDYSRMASMDSELQNAADQAALAAATQLTGIAGARQRAQDAANTYLATAGSAWANETRMANDGGGRTVALANFEFFQSWNHTTDAPGPAASSDANARYVRVTVDGREAFYALTSIGGLLSSGDIAANAVATLEAAACNIPPVMVCSPSGDPGWPRSTDIGIAVDMREGPQNSADFTPGNFDLLNIDYDNLAQSDQNRTLGLNSDLLGCSGAQLQTDPGRRTPQSTAVNTRFGIYPNGNNFACQADGDFCPAQVTRSDLVRRVTVNGNGNNATCANTSGGDLIPYSDVPVSPAVPQQGFPLDTCQSLGLAGCLSFGDGSWPVDTYMNNIHGTTSASVPGLDADGNGRITRYEVYNWERADASRTVSRELARVQSTSPNRTTLYCSAPRPLQGTPVVPSSTQKDRRVVVVAVVDCTGNNGRFDVNTFKFIDMFLLSPMTGSAGSRELKAEIIGPARRADGGSGFQSFGRKKPVLVR